MDWKRGLLLIGVLSTGCTPQPQVQPDAERDLQQLGTYYGRFTAQHRGQSPANEAEFKEFVESEGKAELAARGIEMSDLFQSSRDGAAYTIRYGLKIPPPDASGGPVVAYESQGVDGKRYAVRYIGRIQLLSDQELADLAK